MHSHTSSEVGVKHRLPTRILHVLLAGALVFQLTTSLFIDEPERGAKPGLIFDIHEAVGIASLGILALFWLWTLIRRGETDFMALYPWASPPRRRAVLQDVRSHVTSLARLRLPVPAAEAPLASAVHGFGLLTFVLMSVTGLIVSLQINESGALSFVGTAALALHSLIANPMWAYLIGHSALAVLHQLVGHASIERMFNFRI